MDQHSETHTAPHTKPFFIVGIGASAGGLSALKTFFQAVPSDCPHSFVVVQHLANDYKSMMPELLSSETKLPVREITDNLFLESGHIYLIPPGYNILVDKCESSTRFSRFVLVPKTPKPGLNLPIDLFFSSLAELAQSRAIGVILSGTGSDGSRGIQNIKANEGVVFVQDPQTAEFRGMPDSALDTHIVDFVCSPGDMPNEIMRYIDSIRTGSRDIELTLEKSPETLDEIMKIINEERKIDFSGYKKQMIRRRIAKRILLLQYNDIETYRDMLRDNTDERKRLAQDFLVGVTYFFRDAPVWDLLKHNILPQLLTPERKQLKVWSAGCSTGEEAYSIAILIDEYCTANHIDCSVSIFATDIDRRALQYAQRAIYPASISEFLDEEHLRTYFRRCTDGYEVKSSIRNNVIFSEHNLIDSPPFIQVDLLICRNLLIYLTSPLQQNVMATFEFSLKRDGYLLLGPSETLGNFENRFTPIDKTWRLYSNRKLPPTKTPFSRTYPTTRPNFGFSLPNRHDTDTIKNENLAAMLKATLADGISCCLIIDENFHLLDSAGPYQNYLTMPKESFTNNILNMLPERARISLSLYLRKAQSQTDQTRTQISIERDGRLVQILVTVSPIRDTLFEASPRYALMFREVPQAITSTLSPPPATSGKVDPAVLPDEISALRTYIEELERQLATTQVDLKNSLEESQSSNEELQTTNEELLSSNEELQSTYEEMQSVNEELHTVNTEFQLKNAELMALNADMNNLLNSTEVAVLFVDNEGNIRRFTPAIATLFDLRESDLGRPIKHFMPNMDSASGVKLLSAILDPEHNHQLFEAQSHNGIWFLIKVTPFVNSDGEQHGKVITFIETQELRKTKQELERKSYALEQVLESCLTGGYWDWDIPSGVQFMSPTFKEILGYTDEELPNTISAWHQLIHPDDLASFINAYNKHIQSHGEVPYHSQVRYLHKDKSIRWTLCTGKVIEWDGDHPIRMVGCIVDITTSKNCSYLTSLVQTVPIACDFCPLNEEECTEN